MTAAALISLRETLETSLIIGLILALLSRLQQKRQQRFVWLGVGCGIALSIVVAFLFQAFAASLADEAKTLYEGIMMLAGAGLLTWMIFWMMRMGSTIRQSIERDITLYAMAGECFGIFLVSFTTTAREGTELVLFLNAAFLSAKSDLHSLAGAVAGVTAALLLTFVLFRSTRKFSLSIFFKATAVLLLLFAAGLVSHGIGALQEAQMLTMLQAHVWDARAILSEETLFGGVLESLIGYSDHPTVLQLSAYVLYLTGAMMVWRKLSCKGKR